MSQTSCKSGLINPIDKQKALRRDTCIYNIENTDLEIGQGCHGQGKSSGKSKMFQVREKSGNFIFSQKFRKNENEKKS